MGVQERNVILAHYKRLVNEINVCKILRGGNRVHFYRMVKSLKNNMIFCFRCDDPIERDTEVVSLSGNRHTKIYHSDCYREI